MAGDGLTAAISRAQHEARVMGYATVEVEHLLLGVLEGSGVSIAAVRNQVAARLGDGPGAPEGQLPLSPAAEEKVAAAERIAFGMSQPPRAEHLLVMLLARGEGPASEVLVAIGANPGQIQTEVKQRTWPSPPSQQSQVTGTTRPITEEQERKFS
jgi:ATP-dependent Clp protease ATP-binding subunit ClpC